jgi:predicted O-linked N-acetylglucosamine transferase (SPINDLY family)/SAM-dependent methyltransferase
MHLKAGRLDEATAAFERLNGDHADNCRNVHMLGLIAYQQGKFERAVRLIRQCLTINPNLAEAYSDLGVVLIDMGEFDDAQAACEKAIALKPDFHPAHSNLGNVLKALGKLPDAVDSYRRAIELSPGFVDAYANLGATLLLLGKTEEALDASLRAVEIAPDHVEALIAFTHALQAAGETKDAIAVCRRAIELRPGHGPIHCDLGCLLQADGQLDEAIAAHRRAIELKPGYAEAYNSLGIAFIDLGRNAEALESLKSAVAFKPDYADAYSNMGRVLGRLGQRKDAINAYRRAIELEPKLRSAYVNLAGSLSEQGLLSDAIATYAKALTIDPDDPGPLVDHYHLRRQACDWDGLAAAEQKILAATYRLGKRVPAFPILNMAGDAEDHLLSARAWATGLARPVSKPFSYGRPRSLIGGQRLRIGYLSGDFYRHAAAGPTAELIESHDRAKFEIFGYCYSPGESTAMRHRLISAFDSFANVGPLSHAEAAKRINRDGIDILVDLKGHTPGARTEIIACRPAPIQVSYLGYPGTMGADFIDYIIADDFVAPMNQQPFFDEQIVQLPGCYLPSLSERPSAAGGPSRAECGLPEGGFVFCCFAGGYMIASDMFGLWLRLLQSVPGSVLWLLESNSLMRENLRRKAASLSIDPARLVFAPKLEPAAHLARHRHADLSLDTAPANAYASAGDALAAGLPVLTCAGESFAARICGSLLKAVGLSELTTYSLDQYERAALNLARNPDVLERLGERLVRTKASAPLFDIAQYAKGLEAAYERMAELRMGGEAPRAFAVSETGEERPGGFGTAALAPKPEAVAAKPAPSAQRQALPLPSEIRIAYEACPLCDGRAFSPCKTADCTGHPGYNAILPATLSWLRCSSCGHIFTEGFFTSEAANVLFAKTPPHPAAGHDAEAQRFVSAKIVGQIAKLNPGGDWLDVGFGNASLLFTAEEWGYRPVGVDPRRDNAEALRTLGYETHAAAMDELDMPGRFNVISIADTLVRVPYPGAALAAAKRLLRPGGILFCSMPNMATIVWRILDRDNANPYWGEIEHYHQFTRERLYGLLEEKGFQPVFYNVSERRPAHMDVIAMNG